MSTGAPALVTSQKREPAIPPGPPFPANSANNGLSVDTVTGQIVLGNDNPGVLATLLRNREIPMAGFTTTFSDTVGGIFNDITPAGFRTHNTAFTLDVFAQPGSISIRDRIGGGGNLEFLAAVGSIHVRRVGLTMVLNIEDGTGPPALSMMQLDFTNRFAFLGDVNNKFNGNQLIVDDQFNVMAYNSGLPAVQYFGTGAGYGGFNLGDINNTVDVDLVGNTGNRSLIFRAPAGIYLSLVGAVGVSRYRIGDISATVNGTHLDINDFTQRFVLSNTTLGLAIIDPQGGNLRIHNAGANARIFLANTAVGDGLLLDSANNAITSGSGASPIRIGLTAGENVIVARDMQIGGSVNTGSPGSGAGVWKLGIAVAAASVLDATRYVEVSIGGVVVKLAVII